MCEIFNETLRVQAFEKNGRYALAFEYRQSDGSWRTVLVTGIESPPTIWSLDRVFVSEDPTVEWKAAASETRSLQSAEAFFSQAVVDPDSGALLLSGQAGCHSVKETIAIKDHRHVHVTVTDHLTEPGDTIRLGQFMTHLYFAPDKRISRGVEPLDFAWLPALHRSARHVCADHFFRSPVVIVQAKGCYAALAPDLSLFARHRSIPHALDLRTTDTRIEAPRLSYGICPSTLDGHVYFRHDDDTAPVSGAILCYGFDLFFGHAESAKEVTQEMTSYLWDVYGRRTFADIRPQIMPFEEYGRRYTYVNELPKSVRRATVDGKKCAGIHNAHRRGANFHAWENDLHTGYGIWHFGEKWGDESLRETAEGILQLSLCAPRQKGAFPCIYNFDEDAYEGTLFWTARSADPFRGYDSAAMSVSAWWLLCWFEDLTPNPAILESVIAYAHFLQAAQLPSGAIPTYFFADLQPARPLIESATTAISGAVLTKAAIHTGDPQLKQAAIAAGRFVAEEIVPELNFNDFETYYSCSPKPLHAVDYWSGIRPHNTLSIQWACDQFLALNRLTGEKTWLDTGEHVLSVLSLYQQVWNPSHRSGYLFGGFGVMNTDGEWSDGRQARFVSTYSDYYRATGKTEYLERAVAACRAAFALMDIPENHANEINDITMAEGPGQGYAPENVHHTGPDSGYGWTGMNWSSGGALAASAYLERRFGDVLVDGHTQTVTPVNGVAASISRWNDAEIHLTITSALENLTLPYVQPRSVVVRFEGMPSSAYTVVINHQEAKHLSRQALESGITVQLQ